MRHRARGKIRREIRFLSHGCKAAPPRQRRRLFALLFSALTAVRQASNAPHSRGCECGQQRLAGVFQTTFAKCPTVRTPFFALMAEKYPPSVAYLSRAWMQTATPWGRFPRQLLQDVMPSARSFSLLWLQSTPSVAYLSRAWMRAATACGRFPDNFCRMSCHPHALFHFHGRKTSCLAPLRLSRSWI